MNPQGQLVVGDAYTIRYDLVRENENVENWEGYNDDTLWWDELKLVDGIDVGFYNHLVHTLHFFIVTGKHGIIQIQQNFNLASLISSSMGSWFQLMESGLSLIHISEPTRRS